MTPFYNFGFSLRQIVKFNKADIPLLDDPSNKITVTRQYNNSFVNKQNDQQTNKVSLFIIISPPKKGKKSQSNNGQKNI